MISIATTLSFALLILTFLSLWVYRSPKVWGCLLAASMLTGWYAGRINLIGLCLVAGLVALWLLFKKKSHPALFVVLIIVGLIFKMKILPGFFPYRFTPKFAVGLEGSITGLLPLALLVPLARGADWLQVLKGVIYGVIGIAILVVAATSLGVVHWHFALPSFALERFTVNFFLTCIPEEGFFRGFIQTRLCYYFSSIRVGKLLGLLATSLLFTAAHIFWTSSVAILAFAFLASLLYGGVYLLTKRIESAIITHFLLNFIHMSFFSYHAL